MMAHVAHNALRGQFTITIDKAEPLFEKIAKLFLNYFNRNSQIQQFSDVLSGHKQELLFVPMFEVFRQAEFLRKTLIEGAIDKPKKTKYAWIHLKDRLARCTVLLSGARIEITPALLPIHCLPYFTATTRRVYLTATLPSQVEFIRTFGLLSPHTIRPGGKSGEAQRQFLFMAGQKEETQRSEALALVEKEKACIIARSDVSAKHWVPPAVKFPSTAGNKEIKEFRDAKDNRKLVLSARYDGIDFPGKSCRILILDGLPYGETLIDRFVDQALGIEELRLSHTATRVTQAIGRIFRSNNDHGAVLLCGTELQRWMKDPNNQRFMPQLLQRQIQLGIELTRMVKEQHTSFAELLDGVLSGRKEWDDLYSAHVGGFDTTQQKTAPSWFPELVARERESFIKLWDGNFAGAASAYAHLASDADLKDKRLGAWYRHWEGLALDLNKEGTSAGRVYLNAANVRVELGRPTMKSGLITAEPLSPSAQASRMAVLLEKEGGKLVPRIERLITNLVYGEKTNPCEQALADLGDVLGFVCTRPDTGKTKGRGPDVLWRYPEEHSGIGLDVKTNKQATGQYNKDDIGEVYQHSTWLTGTFPDETFTRAIVGRNLQVSDPSSPPPGLRIIALDQFIDIAERLRELVNFAEAAARETDIAVTVERGIRFFGLQWPQCIDSLKSRLATDRQNDETSEGREEEEGPDLEKKGADDVCANG